MVLDLYYAPTPNGWKITIMLEELRAAGVQLPEANIHNISLEDGEQFKPPFSEVNPNHKIPGLRHGDMALMESCAILQYLGDTFPSSLYPEGEDRWRVIQWLYWQAANLGPVFGNKLSYTRYIRIPDVHKAHPLERFESEARRLLGVLDRQLAESAYVACEDFTIADIALLPWIRAYKWVKVDITGFAHATAWLEKCLERPGVQRGFAYGVPEDEVHSFSKQRRAEYAARGAKIADNANINRFGED